MKMLDEFDLDEAINNFQYGYIPGVRKYQNIPMRTVFRSPIKNAIRSDVIRGAYDKKKIYLKEKIISFLKRIFL